MFFELLVSFFVDIYGFRFFTICLQRYKVYFTLAKIFATFFCNVKPFQVVIGLRPVCCRTGEGVTAFRKKLACELFFPFSFSCFNLFSVTLQSFSKHALREIAPA